MPTIAFIHPDLGIGGAERLVVDAGLALQRKGHRVKFFTAHHDKSHCFKETADGTLEVVAAGDWLPRRILGRCYAFCAYVRMIYVALYLAFWSDFKPDIIICDQISACIPFLRFCNGTHIFFYCHFPDMLLTQRKSLLKRLYRLPLDSLEEYTTGLADVVLVNSKFTAGVFRDTFTSLRNLTPVVLYPSLNFEAFEKSVPDEKCANFFKDLVPNHVEYKFVSINRYERKKDLGLAINAMKELKDACSSEQWKKVHLIIAGGYDERVDENKEHYLELEHLATTLGVKDQITFIRSFSDEEKLILLTSACCLLYTPSNEHFGIVPIEAMFMKCPVIACKSGGPLETVVHETTGFLSEPKPKGFSRCMRRFMEEKSLNESYGKNGHEHVKKNFSFDAFTKTLDSIVRDSSKKSPNGFPVVPILGCILFLFIITIFMLSFILR